MTTLTERDGQIRTLIRRQIAKEESRRDACGYPKGSISDAIMAARIEGMREVLALVDPEPWR